MDRKSVGHRILASSVLRIATDSVYTAQCRLEHQWQIRGDYLSGLSGAFPFPLPFSFPFPFPFTFSFPLLLPQGSVSMMGLKLLDL